MYTTSQHKIVEDFLAHYGFGLCWSSNTTFYPLVLGGRVADKIGCIDIILHELGHVLASPDGRFNTYGFGLKLPEEYIFGHMVVEPTTTQITEHEIRVTCYQHVLGKYLGVNSETESTLSSFEYLPDCNNRPLSITHFEWVCGLFRSEIEKPQYKIKSVLLEIEKKSRMVIK